MTKTLESLTNKQITKFLWLSSYKVIKSCFRYSHLNKQGKIELLRDEQYQAAYKGSYSRYLLSLEKELVGLAAKNLPMRGIDEQSSDEDVKRIEGALNYWKADCEWVLNSIKEFGFDVYVGMRLDKCKN